MNIDIGNLVWAGLAPLVLQLLIAKLETDLKVQISQKSIGENTVMG